MDVCIRHPRKGEILNQISQIAERVSIAEVYVLAKFKEMIERQPDCTGMFIDSIR